MTDEIDRVKSIGLNRSSEIDRDRSVRSIGEIDRDRGDRPGDRDRGGSRSIVIAIDPEWLRSMKIDRWRSTAIDHVRLIVIDRRDRSMEIDRIEKKNRKNSEIFWKNQEK